MYTDRQKITLIRKHLKMTQTQLASALCVTPANISQIEGGVRAPSASLIKLFKLLYCSGNTWWETQNFDESDHIKSSTIPEIINNKSSLDIWELCAIIDTCLHHIRAKQVG